MQHEQFVARLGQEAGIGRDSAERAASATLMTLAERIGSDEASDLAGQLPSELHPMLSRRGESELFGAEAFVRRVAEREGSDDAEEAAMSRLSSACCRSRSARASSPMSSPSFPTTTGVSSERE